MATHTWTLDLAGQLYIDRTGTTHVINTNETMTFTFTDTGTGGTHTGLVGGGLVACTDGYSFTPECDSKFVFTSGADGVAAISAGQVCFVEENNFQNIFNVTSLTMVNADGTGANNITSITMEQQDSPSNVMTWTAINTA